MEDDKFVIKEGLVNNRRQLLTNQLIIEFRFDSHKVQDCLVVSD